MLEWLQNQTENNDFFAPLLAAIGAFPIIPRRGLRQAKGRGRYEDLDMSKVHPSNLPKIEAAKNENLEDLISQLVQGGGDRNFLEYPYYQTGYPKTTSYMSEPIRRRAIDSPEKFLEK